MPDVDSIRYQIISSPLNFLSKDSDKSHVIHTLSLALDGRHPTNFINHCKEHHANVPLLLAFIDLDFFSTDENHYVKSSPPSTAYMSVNRTSIGSEDGLSPIKRQAIIWNNAGISLIGPMETNFNETKFIHLFKKIHLKCCLENGIHICTWQHQAMSTTVELREFRDLQKKILSSKQEHS